MGPVAFRPTIARGLALSGIDFSRIDVQLISQQSPELLSTRYSMNVLKYGKSKNRKK